MLEAAQQNRELTKALTNLMMKKTNAFIDMREKRNQVASAVDPDQLDKIIKATGDDRLINHVALGVAYWKQAGKEVE